jgi:hypothetical protein
MNDHKHEWVHGRCVVCWRPKFWTVERLTFALALVIILNVVAFCATHV